MFVQTVLLKNVIGWKAAEMRTSTLQKGPKSITLAFMRAVGRSLTIRLRGKSQHKIVLWCHDSPAAYVVTRLPGCPVFSGTHENASSHRCRLVGIVAIPKTFTSTKVFLVLAFSRP